MNTQKVLLTPGPLTTSETVKQAMLEDMGTRDTEYQELVQDVRRILLTLADGDESIYTSILLQGSGTYGVESVLTSVVKQNEKVLILSNGAYGERMEQICRQAKVPYDIVKYSMIHQLPLNELEAQIAREDITHVAYIHSETTAGVLNDIQGIQKLIHRYHKISIVDAMSSFASLPMSLNKLDVDYLITSANKCLHGVPGLAIVYAKRTHLEQCEGICPSLSLDLYAQYKTMEQGNGSFRFTSPTHVLRALKQAIEELQQSGGINARHKRYVMIQKRIREAMLKQEFETLVPYSDQSPVITTYLCKEGFVFNDFYDYFKENGYLLYSGKLPQYDAFRIGNIGEISDEDVDRFIALLEAYFHEVR